LSTATAEDDKKVFQDNASGAVFDAEHHQLRLRRRQTGMPFDEKFLNNKQRPRAEAFVGVTDTGEVRA
jgi:hypothetical protein